MAPADAALVERAAAFDAAWLAGRRWFRSKSRPLASTTVEDAVTLVPATTVLVVLRADFADGGSDRYLVPAVAQQPDGTLREPADGDGAWAAIVAAIARSSVADGQAGRFAFEPGATLADLLSGGAEEAAPLPERRLEVEQSNTSVRLGDRLILKVYRLLEPGINPEVEVSAFLTDAGFRWTPRLAGRGTWQAAGEEPATAVMLQELVPSRGDGWSWMLRSLASPPQGPLEALAGAAQIGGMTAEMHAALASRPGDRGFPAEPAPAERLREWRIGAERQLDGALLALSGDDRARLEAVAPRIRARLDAIGEARDAVQCRIHGDYHLGQLLRTAAGFMVIDFEGEPARPLAERRLPASPLRDVAGMLRSFDYAVRTAERDGPDGFAHEQWLQDARSAFLGAYGGADAVDRSLLAAFEAEKACYEIRYEANSRPAWTWLPLEALERLAA
jgi:trehalose synthase-fused probable maltokinase